MLAIQKLSTSFLSNKFLAKQIIFYKWWNNKQIIQRETKYSVKQHNTYHKMHKKHQLISENNFPTKRQTDFIYQNKSW